MNYVIQLYTFTLHCWYIIVIIYKEETAQWLHYLHIYIVSASISLNYTCISYDITIFNNLFYRTSHNIEISTEWTSSHCVVFGLSFDKFPFFTFKHRFIVLRIVPYLYWVIYFSMQCESPFHRHEAQLYFIAARSQLLTRLPCQ